jgi:hypothetical protein
LALFTSRLNRTSYDFSNHVLELEKTGESGSLNTMVQSEHKLLLFFQEPDLKGNGK